MNSTAVEFGMLSLHEFTEFVLGRVPTDPRHLCRLCNRYDSSGLQDSVFIASGETLVGPQADNPNAERGPTTLSAKIASLPLLS